MLKKNVYMVLGGLSMAILASSISYASDQFPGPGESLDHKGPDFLRDNHTRDSDNNLSSPLTPFENKLSIPPSSSQQNTQPPAPPTIPPRRVQK